MGDRRHTATTSGTDVFTIGTGLPTSASQTATLEIHAGGRCAAASPYDFVLFDTNNDSTLDLTHIADDRTTTGGGPP